MTYARGNQELPQEHDTLFFFSYLTTADGFHHQPSAAPTINHTQFKVFRAVMIIHNRPKGLERTYDILGNELGCFHPHHLQPQISDSYKLSIELAW
ncbi:uncharacterized protein J3R85_005653 [Psidium guajava]|nr:uncharacterized protein J3R85_005653 [Psidium guajava]